MVKTICGQLNVSVGNVEMLSSNIKAIARVIYICEMNLDDQHSSAERRWGKRPAQMDVHAFMCNEARVDWTGSWRVTEVDGLLASYFKIRVDKI